MAQVWFTADTHFGHANIIKYCNRPFLNEQEQAQLQEEPRGSWKVSRDTVQKHDEALLQGINNSVREEDELWILGDFCLGKADEALKYVNRILCRNVYLVWGNHDHRSIGSLFSKTIEQGMIKVKDQRIWLNHYPMRSWDGRFHGSWQLYGHVHDRFTKDDVQNPSMLTKDVGVDACDFLPISFSQLATYMKPRMKAFEEEKANFVAGKASANVD